MPSPYFPTVCDVVNSRMIYHDSWYISIDLSCHIDISPA